MYIIRPIKDHDLDALEDFAKTSSLGVINLPKNRDILQEKIINSQIAFSSAIEKPYFEIYMFVLENSVTKELGGTCSIISRMGVIEPHYYYRLDTVLNKFTGKQMQILIPVSHPIGPTELCALYLKPEFRKEGLSRLLSFSRFLFIACHPQRFEEYVVAEMRGYVKEDNTVPFWEAIGRKFLDVSYTELCEMELQGRSFIPSILPQWPLYTSLLPQEAQDHLAKTHDKTVPALKILYEEGFGFTHEIDPFDGGPKIGCYKKDIATIKNCQRAKIDHLTSKSTHERTHLLSNTLIQFRACYGHVQLIKPGVVSISNQHAQALNVNIGDEICFAKLPEKGEAS